MSIFNLSQIRKKLTEHKIDGWLFYDFQGSDPIGREILNLTKEFTQSCRWYYYIPAQGVPVKIVHPVDRDVLDHLPGKKEVYLSWQELEDKLAKLFHDGEHVAIQYSTKNALPFISRVDAGTFELLKSFKINPISSAELIQFFAARWSPGQVNMHINAAKNLNEIVFKAFRMIKRKLKQHEELNEHIVQKYIVNEFSDRSLVSDRAPLVACDKNSGNPNYLPDAEHFAQIYPGSLLQLKLWAKEKSENGVYAVTSWVGYVGEIVPDKYNSVFEMICKARDGAITYVDKALKSGEKIAGWQVDQVARNILKDSGFDNYFLHRSGHSIGKEIYSCGANIDNFETRDDREIIYNTCFLMEPGLYFSEYGMRSGVSVYVDAKGAHIYTQPLQCNIIPITK